MRTLIAVGYALCILLVLDLLGLVLQTWPYR